MYKPKKGKNYFVKAEASFSGNVLAFTDNNGREYHFCYKLPRESWSSRIDAIKDEPPNYYIQASDGEKLDRSKDDIVVIWQRDLVLLNYYFTFCIGDADINKANRYVKIEAASYGEAREIMINSFGTHWAFQYEEADFLPQIEKYGYKEFGK